MNLRKGSAQAVIALILAAMFLTIVTAGGLMNSNQSIPLSESTLVPATPTASSSVTLQGSNDFLIGFNTTNNEFYAQALNSTICFTSSICESVINFATNASPEGGLVQILAGSYPLTYSGIIVPRWVNLEGQGSTNTLIYALSTFNSSQGLITLQAAPSAGINYARYYQTISNLNLNGENVAAYDIYAPHTTSGFGDNYFVIQNDVFQSTRIACIWLGEDVGAGEIASNFFNSGGLFNICMWYTGDMSIHDNDMAGANIGIYAIGSGNSVFEDNKVYMAIYNPSVSMSGWGVVLNATYGMRMIGDRYDQNTVGGIYLYNTNSSTIDSCHTWLNAQNGYCVTGGYDDVITGCTSLEDNGTMGSIFEFISTNDIQVTGCSVQNPGVAGVSPDNLRAFDFYYCVSPTATALTAQDTRAIPSMGWGYWFGDCISVTYSDIVTSGYTLGVIDLFSSSTFNVPVTGSTSNVWCGNWISYGVTLSYIPATITCEFAPNTGIFLNNTAYFMSIVPFGWNSTGFFVNIFINNNGYLYQTTSANKLSINWSVAPPSG